MADFTIEKLYRELSPELQKLEEERLNLLKKINKLKLGLIATALILSAGAAYGKIYWLIAVIVVAGIIMYAFSYRRLIKPYRDEYKTKIFTVMVATLGTGLSYDQYGKIDEALIRKSGLFPEFDTVKSEDVIKGDFDQYSFTQAEISLYYDKPDKRPESGGAYRWLFRGLFFAGQTKETFPADLWILAKDRPLGNELKEITSNLHEVPVNGHKDFTKNFKVYSRDVEAATRMLQENDLNKIMIIKDEAIDDEVYMDFSFIGNQVFIAISSAKDLFEPPIRDSITDFEIFKSNFKYLANTTGLMHHLSLAKTV